jgi:23S rRNA pseudouridine955/2504/2580 synthase
MGDIGVHHGPEFPEDRGIDRPLDRARAKAAEDSKGRRRHRDDDPAAAAAGRAEHATIEHPEGDLLDVTAPLPEHFAASMAQLGFTEADGDLPLEPIKLIPEKAIEKRAAKAYAKEYRKERRGERRKRADAPPSGRSAPQGRSEVKKGPGSRVPSGKPLGRGATGRAASERTAAERAVPGSKPVRRTPAGKTGGAKPPAGKAPPRSPRV